MSQQQDAGDVVLAAALLGYVDQVAACGLERRGS